MEFTFLIVISCHFPLYSLCFRHILLVLFHNSGLKHLLFFQPGVLIFKNRLLGNIFPDYPILDNQPLIPWTICWSVVSSYHITTWSYFIYFKNVLPVSFMTLYIVTKNLSVCCVSQWHPWSLKNYSAYSRFSINICWVNESLFIKVYWLTLDISFGHLSSFDTLCIINDIKQNMEILYTC